MANRLSIIAIVISLLSIAITSLNITYKPVESVKQETIKERGGYLTKSGIHAIDPVHEAIVEICAEMVFLKQSEVQNPELDAFFTKHCYKL